jgi:transposase InsO family protein
VCQLVARYKAGGYPALQKGSRAPHKVSMRTADELEDEIVLLRKQLAERGLDAGAHTIHHHLGLTHQQVPSVSTVWRVLKRRGFVIPQPQKRPKSSYARFEATLPNEMWQSDMTHWHLGDGTGVEIINYLDDCSRVALGSKVVLVAKATDVLECFFECAYKWGFPASVLTDNGCIYTSAYRNGYSAMESELYRLGIVYKHSRPYHPQTCGKVERFHQTLKKYLAKQPGAATLEELQAQIDEFLNYYNQVRPHRAKDRQTPVQAFNSKDKAKPDPSKSSHWTKDTRVRRDRVDANGKFTLRYKSQLYHVCVGRAHKRQRIVVFVAGLDIRVLSEDGELIKHFELDPTRSYQPL